MDTRLAIIVALMLMAGGVAYWRYGSQPAVAPQVEQMPPAGGFAVAVEERRRSDPPEFRRRYTVALGDGFRVEIEATTSVYSFSRDFTAFLYQSNDKFVLFQVGRVADQVLDHELAPKVQAVVDQIVSMDKAFVASNPQEWTDKQGMTWIRKQS